MSTPSLDEHLTKAPLNRILDAVSNSVLKTQEQLNQQSLAIATRLAGVAPEDQITFGTGKYSLLELGFVPEFYQLGETDIKLKMAMQMQSAEQGLEVYGSLLNERNLCGFGFDPQGASEISAKLVPTSAPNLFEKRVGQMIAELAEQAFAVVRAFVIAGDASAMTLYQLQQTGVDELREANLGEYKARLATLEPDEMPNIPSLQQLITQVNAFVVVSGYVSANDTRPLTMKELYETGVVGAVERNLYQYRTKLAEIDHLDNVEQLQIAIAQTNQFAQILGLMQLGQYGGFTIENLSAAGIVRLVPSRWNAYVQQLQSLSLDQLEVLTPAALQAQIDAAN